MHEQSLEKEKLLAAATGVNRSCDARVLPMGGKRQHAGHAGHGNQHALPAHGVQCVPGGEGGLWHESMGHGHVRYGFMGHGYVGYLDQDSAVAKNGSRQENGRLLQMPSAVRPVAMP